MNKDKYNFHILGKYITCNKCGETGEMEPTISMQNIMLKVQKFKESHKCFMKNTENVIAIGSEAISQNGNK